MPNFHIIIPARLASTRLPEKLLKPLAGKPLLQHTYEAALKAGASSVSIATDDVQIEKAMEACGANVIMTASNHPTGTDRLAEAVDRLHLPDDALIVNLQGDEPLMPSILLNQVAQNLATHSMAAIATLSESFASLDEIKSADIVKVVCNAKRQALYFSRAPIPFDRDQKGMLEVYERHLGIYAYRAHFLRAYRHLAPAPCERIEKLEQLRALYYGYAIHVDLAKAYCPPGVDTQHDFDNIKQFF